MTMSSIVRAGGGVKWRGEVSRIRGKKGGKSKVQRGDEEAIATDGAKQDRETQVKN